MKADELIDFINEKTNLTIDQAKEAAKASAAWLKGVLPDDIDLSETFGEFFESAGALVTKATVATKETAKKAGEKVTGVKEGDDAD